MKWEDADHWAAIGVCVVFVIAFILLLVFTIVPAARGADSQPVPYLRVTIGDDLYVTGETVEIHVRSETLGFSDGNFTLEPNRGVVSILVLDQTHDVVVYRTVLPLLNGSGYAQVRVHPLWTSARLNVSAVDYEHYLSGYAEFRTAMSDDYMLARLEAQGANVAGRVDSALDRLDRVQSEDRLLAGAFAGAVIFLALAVLLRRDHRISRRVFAPSFLDLLKWRVFPVTPNPGWVEEQAWMDSRSTWNPGAVRRAEHTRKRAHIRVLRKQIGAIREELLAVREGRVEA